jgi:predicted transcriptional regulator
VDGATFSALSEIVAVGKSGVGGRIRIIQVYAASPSDPNVGQADIIVVDTGAAQMLRVRYNDGGTIRVGDLPLV